MAVERVGCVAVAGPNRSGRDRFIVVASSVESAQHMALAVVGEIGADYRLLGRPAIGGAVVSVVPGLVPVEKPFGWVVVELRWSRRPTRAPRG